jgi:hypothetical protein
VVVVVVVVTFFQGWAFGFPEGPSVSVVFDDSVVRRQLPPPTETDPS